MVHTGTPSRGCGVCRRRRIKCDEKSPRCSYCVKTNQDCRYKDAFDLAWRDQTLVARKSVERRTRAATRYKCQTSTSISHSDQVGICKNKEYLNGLSTHVAPALPSILMEFPELYAISFFFSTYAKPPTLPDERHGFLEYVSPQFTVSQSESTLTMSTMTVASCLYTAWISRNPDNVMSRTFYGKAISAMKEQIETPVACTNNEILTSVLLLQMYETLLSNAKQVAPSNLHLHGALSIIKHRGLQNFEDDTSKGLLAEIRHQLIEQSFTSGKPVSEDVRSWSRVLDVAQLPPTIHLGDIDIDLADLVASATNVLARSKSSDSFDHGPSIGELLQQAYSIETRLVKWCSKLPLSWLPIRVSGLDFIPPSVKEAGLYQDYCHIYSSVSVSTTWNKYRISLIRTHSVLISLYSLGMSGLPIIENSPIPTLLSSRQEQEAKIKSSLSRVQALADDICASVPFRLGDKVVAGRIGDTSIRYPSLRGQKISEAHYRMAPALGAFGLLMPFQVLLNLRRVFGDGVKLRDGQLQWVMEQIGRIGRLYNMGKRWQHKPDEI